jgi:hypothetical protein
MADEDGKKKAPLLDLATLIVRPKIAIDGKMYEMLSPEELSVVDSQRFTLWGSDIVDMVRDADKATELGALVETLARKVAVGVPDEVFAKLSGVMQFNIVEVFTMLLLATKAKLVGAAALALGMNPETLVRGQEEVIGAKSSPDSSASTEARRTGGSSKRRSAS